MKAALRTEGITTTQRALSRRSWGISSGTSRISWSTVPALCRRSISLASSAFGGLGAAKERGAKASRPKIADFQRVIVIVLRFLLPNLLQITRVHHGPESGCSMIRALYAGLCLCTIRRLPYPKAYFIADRPSKELQRQLSMRRGPCFDPPRTREPIYAPALRERPRETFLVDCS